MRTVLLGLLIALLSGCGTFVRTYPAGDVFFSFDDGAKNPDAGQVRRVVSETLVPGNWANCYSFHGYYYYAYIRTTAAGHKVIATHWPELVCILKPGEDPTSFQKRQDQMRVEVKQHPLEHWKACSGN